MARVKCSGRWIRLVSSPVGVFCMVSICSYGRKVKESGLVENPPGCVTVLEELRRKMHEKAGRCPGFLGSSTWVRAMRLVVALGIGLGLVGFMDSSEGCTPEVGIRNSGPIAGESSPSSSTRGSDTPESQLLPVEANLVFYVNQERARYGLRPLQVSPRLQTSARRHCFWMASNHTLVHTSEPVAENIAMGQENSKEAVRSWMNSPGHRANILGPYRWIGAAAYRATSGVIYWCLQFAR